MGFFDAFLRGAAGQGFIELARSNERQAELDRQFREREAAREDQQKFREEQARLDRMARYGFGDDGQGGVLRRAGTRGAGGAGGPDPESDERAAILGIMRERGASMPEAQALYYASREGANPYTRQTQETQAIDDGDRTRNVTVNGSAPDVDKYVALNRTIARAIQTGSGGNVEQQATARIKDSEMTAAESAGQGDQSGVLTSLAYKGKGRYDANGTDAITGKPVPGSEAEASRTEKLAQAGRAGAETRKADNETGSNPRAIAQLRMEVADREKAVASAEDRARKLIPEIQLKTAKSPEALQEIVRNSPEVRAARAKLEAAQSKLDAAYEGDKSAPRSAPRQDKPLPLPRDKGALIKGKVYQTSRGAARWNGSMFEAI